MVSVAPFEVANQAVFVLTSGARRRAISASRSASVSLPLKPPVFQVNLTAEPPLGVALMLQSSLFTGLPVNVNVLSRRRRSGGRGRVTRERGVERRERRSSRR